MVEKGQLYSHPVGHGMKCDKTAAWLKNGSLTYKLLIMECKVMRLLGKEKGYSIHSQAVGQWTRCDETACRLGMDSVAHILCHDEVWWEYLSEKGQYYSLAVNHGIRNDVTRKRKGSSATHSLLVMGWDVMNLYDEKHGGITHSLFYIGWDDLAEGRTSAPLTYYWSCESDEVAWQKWQCHSQTVGHGRDNVMRLLHGRTEDSVSHSHTIGHMIQDAG